MVTISQLAAYAGVTVRAVRHYHKVGLLPEPARDSSGYRTYEAAAVVRLIRIATLAGAGVPLARVQELLDAGPDEFAAGVESIDRDLRAEILRLQRTRRGLARLAAGDHLALPPSVTDYLDRLRELGIEEQYIELERDAWILVAARLPERIDEYMVRKQRELEDPDMVKLYGLIGGALDWSVDDPRIEEVADILDRLWARAVEAGATGPDGDDLFVDLMDAAMRDSAPAARRLLALMEQRGWKGWTRIERVTGSRAVRSSGQQSPGD